MRCFPAPFLGLLCSGRIQHLKERTTRGDWDLQSLSRFLLRFAGANEGFTFPRHITLIVSVMVRQTTDKYRAIRNLLGYPS